MIDSRLFKTEPRQHQINALMAGMEKPSFGYLMKPGTGKTKVIIDEVTQLGIKDILVIAPLTVLDVWKEQLSIHGPSKYNLFRYPYAKPIYYCSEDATTWLLMSVDALINEQGKKRATRFLQNTPKSNMMVIDESTYIKNVQAKRTQACLKLAPFAGIKRILTGTAIANKPMDLYSQLLFLNPRMVHGLSYWGWRNRYCIMGGFQGKQIVGYRKMDEVSKMMEGYVFMAGKEHLNLPPKTYQVRHTKLSSTTARKFYANVLEEIRVAIENSTVTVPMMLNKMNKLQQVTGGAVLDDFHGLHHIDRGKINEVLHLLEEGIGKTIIWCQFLHEIEWLSYEIEKAGYTVRKVDGAVSSQSRTERIKEFENGRVDVMIIQNRINMGITLNAAETVIFYSLYWTPDWREQAEDRSHRDGQTKSVNYIDLIVPGTIDEVIYKSIQDKATVANLVTKNLGMDMYNILKGEGE